MKIGMVTEFYYPSPGGVSEHVRSLSRELRLLGHEVKVLTSHIKGRVNEPERGVIRVGRSLPLPYNGSLGRVSVGWRLGRQLEKVFEREGFDLLHLHNPYMPVLPTLTLKKAPCPIVGTFHSNFTRDPLLRLLGGEVRRRFGNLDQRISVSDTARSAAEKFFPGDYRTIPNGVDFEFFSRAASRPDHVPGLKPDKLHILFVGAVVRRKGLPWLLNTFAALSHRREDVDLLVIGDGPDRLRLQHAMPAGLKDRVHFLGFVPRRKLADYYAAADIFCAPSLGRESFGMVLLEAMAAGLPVLAADIDGYRDVVTDSREGILVPPRDEERLSLALDYLLDHPEERKAYGRRGQMKAEQFGWASIATQLDGVYREVLGLPHSDSGEFARVATP